MVKRWILRKSGRRTLYLRREPTQETAPENILRSLKNGDIVSGEFMQVIRASREVGFVNVQHLEPQCGSSWRIRNAHGTTSTLLRKHPNDSNDAPNTVGYATEGELVVGEFVFVKYQDDKRGGYVKRRHLKAMDNDKNSDHTQASHSAAMLVQQRWTVMDASHDGAWLRRAPQAGCGRDNVVCLLANGDTVVGDFIYIRRVTGESGFARFKDLEGDGKTWRIRSAAGSATTVLRKRPKDGHEAKDMLCCAGEGERVEGEFVFVTHKNGRRCGFVKRRYLTALLPAAAHRGASMHTVVL